MNPQSLPKCLFGLTGQVLATLCLAGAANAQLLVGVLTNSPQATVWHIDVTTGQRTPLFHASSSALAVDDANGIVYSAELSKLSKWTYGAGPTATLLGTVHVATGAAVPIVGMAFGGGRLFGTTWQQSGQAWLYEIDPTTLVATPKNMPVQLPWVEGLSFDAAANVFYAANDIGGIDDDLYVIDLLNGGTPQYLGALGGDADSAAKAANGPIYIVPDSGGSFSTFDLATGLYQFNAFWSPFSAGLDESASEWAPSLVPPSVPNVFCLPTGPSSCKIHADYTGVPSASAGSGFDVVHSLIAKGSRTQVHYSLAGSTQAPFGGALRCIRAPVFRLPPTVLPSSGSPCQSVSVDFNAYISSGVNPALVAGQPVWMQLAAQTPSLMTIAKFDLSPGLSFTIGP